MTQFVLLQNRSTRRGIYVNMAHITNFCSDDGGSIVTLGDGRHVLVSDTPAELMKQMEKVST